MEGQRELLMRLMRENPQAEPEEIAQMASREMEKGPADDTQREILMRLMRENPEMSPEEIARMASREMEAATPSDTQRDLLMRLMRENPGMSPEDIAKLASTTMGAQPSEEHETEEEEEEEEEQPVSTAASRRERDEAAKLREMMKTASPQAVAITALQHKAGEGIDGAQSAAMRAFAQINDGDKAPDLDQMKKMMMLTLSDKQHKPLDSREATVAGGAGAALRKHDEQQKKDEEANLTQQIAMLLSRQPPELLAAIRHPVLWQTWLDKLGARGFFTGLDRGTPEFDKRILAAAKKFATSAPVKEQAKAAALLLPSAPMIPTGPR